MYIVQARNVIVGYQTIGEYKTREEAMVAATREARRELCDQVSITRRIEEEVVRLDQDGNTIYFNWSLW